MKNLPKSEIKIKNSKMFSGEIFGVKSEKKKKKKSLNSYIGFLFF
jgi:hypothetical protein